MADKESALAVLKYALIVSVLTYVEERKEKFENSSTFRVLRLQQYSFLLFGILSADTHYMAGVYPPETFVGFADLVDTSDRNPLAGESADIGERPIFLSDLFSGLRWLYPTQKVSVGTLFLKRPGSHSI